MVWASVSLLGTVLCACALTTNLISSAITILEIEQDERRPSDRLDRGVESDVRWCDVRW